MYRALTHGIEVTVEPAYLEERSDPGEGRWVWAYTIRIGNGGPRPVQLLSRFWRITDGNGRVEIVEGRGVVGVEPLIQPGEAFQYTSGCPLTTSSGIMEGLYRMIDEDGHTFEVTIPAFSLDLPGAATRVN